MGIFGWSYPPGAENDPYAPYNQDDDESASLRDEAMETLGNIYQVNPDDEHFESRVKRGVYKHTECGAWIEFHDDRIVVGSIVEGCDFGTQTYALHFDDDFCEKLLFERLRAVEKEAEAIWQWANKPDDSGKTPAEQGIDAPDIAFEFAHLTPEGRSS